MPRKITDIEGERYGMLVAIRFHGIKKSPNGTTTRQWLFLCDCGNEYVCNLGSVRSGGSKSCGCRKINKLTGCKSYNWKGGKMERKGYAFILDKNNPNARDGRYVPEHVKVMSETIGRPLLPNETVHHKNGIRNDNQPENLELWCKSQPSGQRVIDLLDWARDFIKTYG